MNCLHCHKIFKESKKQVNRGIKLGTLKGRFCSLRCSSKWYWAHHRPQLNCTCATCHKSIHVKQYRRNKSKSGLLFCSRRCQSIAVRKDVGILSIKSYTRPLHKCLTCGKEFYAPQLSKFCSARCHISYVKINKIKKCFYCGRKTTRGKRCSACITKIRRVRAKFKIVEYLGGKCSKCGCTNYIVLTCHHRDPKTKDFNVGRLSNKSWSVIVRELNKCILLCANCHIIEHSNKTPGLVEAAKNYGNAEWCSSSTHGLEP